MDSEKKGIKICLMVEHRCEEMSNTIYMIEPPSDVGEYEEERIDSDGLMIDPLSPVISLDNDYELLNECAMARLGSRIYFFGGVSNIYDHYFILHKENIPFISNELKLSVRFFDIDHPELGLCGAASLNAPKETPCVFSSGGMIYALGSCLKVCNSKFYLDDGTVATGIFERYDPIADKWQVLPDPPLPFGQSVHFTYCDAATLIADRYVFVGNPVPRVYIIFDLYAQKWGNPFPESFIASHFPYGSLCVDNSIYYLTGFSTHKSGTQYEAKTNWLDEEEKEYRNDYRLQIVKRGPLSLEDPSRLLNSCCFRPENKQVMIRLDQVPLLNKIDTYEWRDIFHLGGRFFCYVVTAPLINNYDGTNSQPYCRGVWIDVLEEVELPASKSTHFRTLASFSYRIRTPFHNSGSFIRCCAFGSVPDAWVKEPLKKKQVVEERKTFKAEQIQHEHGGGSKGQGDCILEKTVSVAAKYEDEEIIRLRDELAKVKAELAKKDELLKTLKSFFVTA